MDEIRMSVAIDWSYRLSRSLLKSTIALDSLPEFIRQSWSIVEPGELIWNWHIDVLCEVLTKVTEGKLRFVRIMLPPGYMKSYIINVFWPAWEWARDPTKRYLTFAYSIDNTIRDNRRVRSIVTSEWYRLSFGVELTPDQSAKIRFDTTVGGWRIASSVAGQGTGDHPDRIIIDDALKAQDRHSEAKVTECNDWYDSTISTRMARKPAVIVCGQRLVVNDIHGHLESKSEDQWYTVTLPVRYMQEEPITESNPRGYTQPDPLDKRTENGQLLWPEKYDEEEVRRQEIFLGEYGKSAQLQQRPLAFGGNLFKREHFPIVDILPPLHECDICRGWDTAESDPPEGKKKSKNDSTVGVKLLRHRVTKIIYIASVVKIQSVLVDNLILTTTQLDGRKSKVREGSGSGKAVTKARSILLAGYDYDVSPETDSKTERANPFRSQCEMGNVRMLRASWNESYLDIMCSFPGPHDDEVDATSNAANELLGVSTPKKRRLVLGSG